ncbi:MAG: DMT family protein, partial [Desulfocapsaceae bacterium]|nr:DMT family protein [Desulfocapsaceae bacterium]
WMRCVEKMNPYIVTLVLLCCSNVFMTFAWYGHLTNMAHRTWIVAALVSWGIALFEYLLQVPANRIGHQVMNVGQLKILQEVVTLAVFVPFSLFYVKEKLSLDYLWAGMCLLGAVFFLFRSRIMGA